MSSLPAGWASDDTIRFCTRFTGRTAVRSFRLFGAFVVEEASGSFPDAVNIPLDQLRQRLHELPKDKEILVACQVGLRGHVACRMLIQYGFKARNLTGGFKTYQMVTTKF